MMVQSIILILASLWGGLCFSVDANYYSTHPKALKKIIATCSENNVKDLNCDQLKNIESHINESAYQLQSNPQGYGKIILDLQTLIAKQALALREGSNQSGLQSSINDNTQHLQERLAIVKWLESPES